jgi:hypothetical protein
MLERRREYRSDASQLSIKGACALYGCQTTDPIRKSQTHSLNQQLTEGLLALNLYGTSCETQLEAIPCVLTIVFRSKIPRSWIRDVVQT